MGFAQYVVLPGGDRRRLFPVPRIARPNGMGYIRHHIAVMLAGVGANTVTEGEGDRVRIKMSSVRFKEPSSSYKRRGFRSVRSEFKMEKNL